MSKGQALASGAVLCATAVAAMIALAATGNAVLVLALVAVGVGGAMLVMVLGTPLDPLLLTTGFVLLTGFIDSASGVLSYAPVVVAGIALAVARGRLSAPWTAFHFTAALLLAFGLIGSAYGRIVQDETLRGALPILLPLLLVLLGGPSKRHWLEADIRRGAIGLSFLCSAVLIAVALAYSFEIEAARVFNHEKAFVGVLALGLAVAARSTHAIVAAAASLLLAILANPAATYVLAASAAMATLFLLRWRPGVGARVGLAMTVVVLTAAVTLAAPFFTRLFAPYFEWVGKGDNSDTRLALLRVGLLRVEDWILGSLFTDDLTVTVPLSGELREVPVHNDIVTLYIGGGVIAVGLFLTVVLLLNGGVIRAFSQMTSQARRLSTVLLAASNAAFASSLANPVLMNASATVMVACCMATLLMLRASSPDKTGNPSLTGSNEGYPIGNASLPSDR